MIDRSRLRWLVPAVAIVIAIITVWALGPWGHPGEASLVRGDEVFAIDPHTITEVRYTSQRASVVAKRGGEPAGTFAIDVNIAAPQAQQKCRSGATFARLLNELSSVRVKATLNATDREGVQRELGARGAKFELLDNTPIDAKEFHVVMFGSPPRLVFVDGPLTYEPSISAELFDRLSGGCPRLSGDAVAP